MFRIAADPDEGPIAIGSRCGGLRRWARWRCTEREALTGVSPVLATVYLMARLLIPAVLITIITRTASAEQRIALLRDYLHHATTHTQHHGEDQVAR